MAMEYVMDSNTTELAEFLAKDRESVEAVRGAIDDLLELFFDHGFPEWASHNRSDEVAFAFLFDHAAKCRDRLDEMLGVVVLHEYQKCVVDAGRRYVLPD